jgi:hypothetical protein
MHQSYTNKLNRRTVYVRLLLISHQKRLYFGDCRPLFGIKLSKNRQLLPLNLLFPGI